MAQRLEGADRSAELLADRNMLDGRRQCRLQQAARFRRERDAQPLAYFVCRLAAQRRDLRLADESAPRLREERLDGLDHVRRRSCEADVVAIDRSEERR